MLLEGFMTRCIPITSADQRGFFRCGVRLIMRLDSLLQTRLLRLLSYVLFPLRAEFPIPAKRHDTDAACISSKSTPTVGCTRHGRFAFASRRSLAILRALKANNRAGRLQLHGSAAILHGRVL